MRESGQLLIIKRPSLSHARIRMNNTACLFLMIHFKLNVSTLFS